MHKIYLRFDHDTNGCCILLGPELCQNPAFWKSPQGNIFCAAHAVSGFKQYIKTQLTQKTQPTCDKCLPRICCQNIPVWQYEETGGRKTLLCEQHGIEFKVIRPTFEFPRPEGYGAKRIK